MVQIDNGIAAAEFDNFSAADYINSKLIIVEPKRVRTAKTKFGDTQFTDCDFAIFSTDGEVESRKPSVVLSNAGAGGNLGRGFADCIGRVVVGVLGQVPSKKGNPAWVFNRVPNNLVEVAQEYLDAREAGGSGDEGASGDDVPAFLRE